MIEGNPYEAPGSSSESEPSLIPSGEKPASVFLVHVYCVSTVFEACLTQILFKRQELSIGVLLVLLCKSVVGLAMPKLSRRPWVWTITTVFLICTGSAGMGICLLVWRRNAARAYYRLNPVRFFNPNALTTRD